jgi:MYXO-CTERM domain-containing protein
LALLSIPSLVQAIDINYVEDFEDDNLGNTAGDFATAVFKHNIVGANSFITDDTPPLPIPPSIHHQFFMGAATSDDITFTLPAGQYVIDASVAMTGTGGGAAAVTFMGDQGSHSFTTTFQDLYQSFATTGLNLGKITQITLNLPLLPDPPGPGPEALYDDIMIHVVPEPSSLILAAGALLGLVGIARLRRRSEPLWRRR